MKQHGSGQLPAEVVRYKDAEVSCVANDAFATVKIALKAHSEHNYRAVLTWLCRLLEADFPRSHEIAFRSPAKHYLPVKGLPKKGVHQLFANATGYPELRPFIAQYARLAMREHEWYTNIDEADPAMPGTFAVFAVALLVACAGNIQHFEPVKAYAASVANRESLIALANARSEMAGREPSGIARLTADLDGGGCVPDHAWKVVVHAIWGRLGARIPRRSSPRRLTSSRHCTTRCWADRACGLARDNPD
ncbi:hypothetical protein WL77_24435 [Burkholderia ubonensis]|nr:hypothetical protein WL77_24435 [Burkholderia ubonensis]